MAGKTLTDQGSGNSAIGFHRGGGEFYVNVEVRFGPVAAPDGCRIIALTQAEVLAAVPATALPNGTTRRQAMAQVLDLLYAAAVAKDGWS